MKAIKADGKRVGFFSSSDIDSLCGVEIIKLAFVKLERFLGAVEVLKLQVPKPHNSLEETQQWLTEGGVISAVKSFYFLEEHDAYGNIVVIHQIPPFPCFVSYWI